MDNRGVARCLHEIADLLDIKGENSFRIRSYRVAAETVENHGGDVVAMVRRGEDLKSLPGVGAGIAGKIQEIVEQGECAYQRELLAEVPRGLLELLELPGLGPKGVSLVWRQLGVTSADELEAAITGGRFRTLPGMKDKKEARILKGLQERRNQERRFLLPVAAAAAERLIAYLKEHGAQRVEAAGSYRRRRESIGDLDLLAVGGEAEALARALTTHPDVKEVLAQGAGKSSVVLSSGLQVDLKQVEPDSIGAALQYFTGGKGHNIATRERAVRRGLKLNEYGVFRVDTGERVAGATEDEVYQALGLRYIPPEMREGRGEIERAEAGTLPALVEEADVLGDLHAHTTESDGKDSLEAMVAAARARGLRYLALTEHSRAIPSPTMGSGMDEARCLAHIRRLRAYQERVPDLRLLAGVEVDILPDGRLDMDDEVLAQLDVVVASLHSQLTMEPAKMTDRVLKAFENPYFQIWGHPLARRLFQRLPVGIDLERVFTEAGRQGVTLEINSQPQRLDLPDHLIRSAREKGLRFVISTDSHSTSQLENMRWGVGQARRGWLGPEDVLNTRPADGLLALLRRPSGQATSPGPAAR